MNQKQATQKYAELLGQKQVFLSTSIASKHLNQQDEISIWMAVCVWYQKRVSKALKNCVFKGDTNSMRLGLDDAYIIGIMVCMV